MLSLEEKTLLNLSKTEFFSDPFPTGIAQEVLDPEYYNKLVESFPSYKLALAMDSGYYGKYSMSERFNRENYYTFLKSTPLWAEFHNYIKSRGFMKILHRKLKNNGCSLSQGQYKSRFEFSFIPGDGYILPHTDIPSKVVTLIIPMIKENEWDLKWGGSTDMLKPKYPDKTYKDYVSPLSDFDIVRSYPFEPNQCVIFIKSSESWHSVQVKGPSGSMRQSITINIERVK